MTHVALTFEVTVRAPAEQLAALLRSLVPAAKPVSVVPVAVTPLPPAAEPPKEQRGRARPPAVRPSSVTCETPECGAVLAVGSRGVLPRFYRRCASRRGRGPLPESHPVDVKAIRPAEPVVVNRRTEVERRIGAMMALDQGDARARSTLLKRFDERRRR